jgi:hypothetical protein
MILLHDQWVPRTKWYIMATLSYPYEGTQCYVQCAWHSYYHKERPKCQSAEENILLHSGEKKDILVSNLGPNPCIIWLRICSGDKFKYWIPHSVWISSIDEIRHVIRASTTERGDQTSFLIENKNGNYFDARVMRGSMTTHKKITRMKVFVHFQWFYSFDYSSKNLRCEPVPFLQTPFLFDTGLVISLTLTNEMQTKFTIFKSVRAVFPVFSIQTMADWDVRFWMTRFSLEGEIIEMLPFAVRAAILRIR